LGTLEAAGAANAGTAGSPGTAGTLESLALPSAKGCLRVSRLSIRLRDPKYDPLKTVTVTVNGRRVASTRKGSLVVAIVKLKGLPKGALTIRVRATTVLGHHLSASHTYRRCRTKHKKRHRKG
jgi:hypothetical protein